MSSAVWRCSWLKITWSSTWMEPLPAVRCLGSAGSRSVTKWLTEGGTRRIIHASILCVFVHALYSSKCWLECKWTCCLVLLLQTEEEPEVFGHCASDMVHTHCVGYIQAFYQVRQFWMRILYRNPRKCICFRHSDSFPQIICFETKSKVVCMCFFKWMFCYWLSFTVWSSWIRSSMSTAWMNWQRSCPWSMFTFLSALCSKSNWPLDGSVELQRRLLLSSCVKSPHL